jgi:hypothetical protein
MRRGLIIRLFSVCLAAMPVAAFTGQETKKRVVVDEFQVDRDAPPDTLDAMWREAKAVVVLKVLSAAPRPAPFDPLLLRPRLGYDKTTWTAEVVEVLKDDRVHFAGTGRIVHVYREHGDTDQGDYILRRIERDFPAFVKGHEYVLFLNWNEHMQLFVVAYGPDAAYDVTNGLIETAGRGAVARSFKGKPAKELLDQLQAIKRKSAR